MESIAPYVLRILTLLLTVSTCREALAAGKPNILWLSCEDISAHLGCYGDSLATTPNLDRLAASGVRYENAFVTAGVCAPCRSAVITGVMQTTLGTHHMRCRVELPAFMKLLPQYMRETGYYCTNNSKTDYQLAISAKEVWDESSGKAHWKNRPDAKTPFFAVFNFTGCHESGIASADKFERVTGDLGKAERHDPAALTPPPYYPDTPVVREDWRRYYDVITAMDRWAGERLRELESAGLAEETIVFFWSDHGVGLPRAKRWLYDSGMRVPLIARIPARLRQGEQGRPGSVDRQLVSLIDLAPTVLNLARAAVPGHFQGRAFLGEGLSPPRRYVYGARDRMDERYDIIRAVRDARYKYLRNYEPLKTYYQYMNTPEKGATMREIRRLHALGELPAEARLFLAPTKPTEELYDTEKDPHEVHNLAASPEHRSVLQRLRRAHETWVRESRDLGLLPEPELVRRERELESRHAILRQDDSEELMARLHEAAATASMRNAESIPRLRRFLSDRDPAVRYWGAVGLGNLGRKALAEANSLRTRLAEDDAPVVRVAVARALCRMDRENDALPVLIRELGSPEEWVRLHAAIVLDEIDDKARPAVPALEKARQDRQNKYVARVANRALNELLGTDSTVR